MTLCECGCGNPAPIASRSMASRGWVKGQPKRYIRGHSPRPSAVERFWAKVNKTETCWLWTGARDGNGYGSFSVDGRARRVHRFAYELLVGPIPEGLSLDHLCRVRHCVRPDHLDPVTHRENVLRGIGPTARNAAMTHCDQGHEFSPENTYINPKGQRNCRECKRSPEYVLPALRTHCPRGHEYDEANTYISPYNGSRNCRRCARIRKGRESA